MISCKSHMCQRDKESTVDELTSLPSRASLQAKHSNKAKKQRFSTRQEHKLGRRRSQKTQKKIGEIPDTDHEEEDWPCIECFNYTETVGPELLGSNVKSACNGPMRSALKGKISSSVSDVTSIMIDNRPSTY